MRRKTGKKPQVVDVIDVPEEEAGMEDEDEATLFENDDQGMTRLSEAVEKSLAKGLSDIVDMCEGRIELDYEEEELEEGKDYEKELWEAFEELEALAKNRGGAPIRDKRKKQKSEQTVPGPVQPPIKVPQIPQKIQEPIKLQEQRSSIQQTDKKSKNGKHSTIDKPQVKQTDSREEAKGTKSGFEPSVNKLNPEKLGTKQAKVPEVPKTKKESESKVAPWYQRGIYYVCKSYLSTEKRVCGVRCPGRRVFREHLSQGEPLFSMFSPKLIHPFHPKP